MSGRFVLRNNRETHVSNDAIKKEWNTASLMRSNHIKRKPDLKQTGAGTLEDMEQLIDALSSRCESGEAKKLPTPLPLSSVVDILHDTWVAAGLYD